MKFCLKHFFDNSGQTFKLSFEMQELATMYPLHLPDILSLQASIISVRAFFINS